MTSPQHFHRKPTANDDTDVLFVEAPDVGPMVLTQRDQAVVSPMPSPVFGGSRQPVPSVARLAGAGLPIDRLRRTQGAATSGTVMPPTASIQVLRRQTLRRAPGDTLATPEQAEIRDAIALALPQLPPKVQRFLRALPPEAEGVVMSLDPKTVKSVLVGLAFLTPEQQDALGTMSGAELARLVGSLLTATYQWAGPGHGENEPSDGMPSEPGALALLRPTSGGPAPSGPVSDAGDNGRAIVPFLNGRPGSSQPTGITLPEMLGGSASGMSSVGGIGGKGGIGGFSGLGGNSGPELPGATWPGEPIRIHLPRPLLQLTLEPSMPSEPPLLSIDKTGEYTVHPTTALLEAFEKDLVGSKTYLQEGEGELLAQHLGVTAEIFDQHDREIPIIQRNLAYGSSGKKGTLLYVNQNHYIVLNELDKADNRTADFTTAGGRRFLVGKRTVIDGDCLIHGLLIIAGETATEGKFRKLRMLVQRKSTEELTRQTLEGILTGLLAGDFPGGLGANTWKVIDTEPRFRLICRQKEQEKKEADQRKALAESQQFPVKSGAKADSGGHVDPEELAIQIAIAQSLQTPVVKNPLPDLKADPVTSTPAKDPDGKSEVDSPNAATGTLPKKSVKPPPFTATTLPELEALLLEHAKNPPEGLLEVIAQRRKELSTDKKGSGDGLPHVFNKIYKVLVISMKAILEKGAPYCKDTNAPKEFLTKVELLDKEFEADYRSHLIANMPPTEGPDENSIAFGSEFNGLRFLMDACFNTLLELALSDELEKAEMDALRQRYRSAVNSVKAQMHQLKIIGIDKHAETFVTTKSNPKLNKEKAVLIAAAKNYLDKQTAIVSGEIIPSFYQALGIAIRTKNAPPKRPTKVASEDAAADGKKPPSTTTADDPTTMESGQSAVAIEKAKQREVQKANAVKAITVFSTSLDEKLAVFDVREKERALKGNGPNPNERATEILTELKKFWGNQQQINGLLDSAGAHLAVKFKEAKRIAERVYQHATQGRKSAVLPGEASEANEPKANSEFATTQHPVIGGPPKLKVQFASTKAKNVVYNTQQQALQAARAMIVVNPSDVLHARYLIGPKGKNEPKMGPDEVRIEIVRDQNNSDVGEGYVEEYITDHGPMILAYHTQDCNAKIKVGKEERAFVPHFHVGTLPGNSIDKDYWAGEKPEDRLPQYGIGLSGVVLDGPRTAKGQKQYVQHQHDHHLYHL